jgi:hypothetical protein
MRNAIISQLTLNASGAISSSDVINSGNMEILDVDVTAVTGTSITLPLNNLSRCQGAFIMTTVDSTGAFVLTDAVPTINNPTTGSAAGAKPTITLANGTAFVLANLRRVRVLAYGYDV